MCLKSNPFKGASGTAWGNFALGAGESILGHSKESTKVDNRNRELLAQHERNRHNYHHNYREREVAWKNDNLNRAIGIDNGYQQSIEALADSQLKVWQSIKEGTVAEQEAFAAMMSVGGGEQTGARSGSSTSRREAVMAYGHKMNQIAAAKAGGKDSARLYAAKVRQRFAQAANQSDIESGTSRPTYGAAPAAPTLEARPSKWNMLLGIGRSALSSKMLYDKLTVDDNSTTGGTRTLADTGKTQWPWEVDGPVFGDDLPVPDMDDIPEVKWPDQTPEVTFPDIDGPVFKDLPVPKTEAKGDTLLGKRSQNIFLTTM